MARKPRRRASARALQVLEVEPFGVERAHDVGERFLLGLPSRTEAALGEPGTNAPKRSSARPTAASSAGSAGIASTLGRPISALSDE